MPFMRQQRIHNVAELVPLPHVEESALHELRMAVRKDRKAVRSERREGETERRDRGGKRFVGRQGQESAGDVHFLNETLLGPVDVPEGHVASAVGRKDAEWWQKKLLECLHAMAHNEEAYGNDPNRVTLTLRAVRGLAEHCWRSKYETSTPENPELETTSREDDWCAAVCKCTKQRNKRRGKKRRRGKKGKKKA